MSEIQHELLSNDGIQGILSVLLNKTQEVEIIYSRLKVNDDSVGCIFLSKQKAIHLANLLLKAAEGASPEDRDPQRGNIEDFSYVAARTRAANSNART